MKKISITLLLILLTLAACQENPQNMAGGAIAYSVCDMNGDSIRNVVDISLFASCKDTYDANEDGVHDVTDVKLYAQRLTDDEWCAEHMSECLTQEQLSTEQYMVCDHNGDGLRDVRDLSLFAACQEFFDADNDGFNTVQDITLYAQNYADDAWCAEYLSECGETNEEEMRVCDHNGDGLRDISDLVLFASCKNSIDANNDGVHDLSDIVYYAQFYYSDVWCGSDFLSACREETQPALAVCDHNGDGLRNQADLNIFNQCKYSLDVNGDGESDSQDALLYAQNFADDVWCEMHASVCFQNDQEVEDSLAVCDHNGDGMRDVRDLSLFASCKDSFDADENGVHELNDVVELAQNYADDTWCAQYMSECGLQQEELSESSLAICDHNGDGMRDITDVALFAACKDSFDADGNGVHELQDVILYAQNSADDTWCEQHSGTCLVETRQGRAVCDLTGDGMRDISDVVQFSSCQDTFDANGDGAHDLHDVVLYAENYADAQWCAEHLSECMPEVDEQEDIEEDMQVCDLTGDGLRDISDLVIFARCQDTFDANEDGLHNSQDALALAQNYADDQWCAQYMSECVVEETDEVEEDLFICDHNGDGMRDVTDIAIFASCKNTFDANGDGVHDIRDVSFYAANLYDDAWCGEAMSACLVTETDDELEPMLICDHNGDGERTVQDVTFYAACKDSFDANNDGVHDLADAIEYAQNYLDGEWCEELFDCYVNKRDVWDAHVEKRKRNRDSNVGEVRLIGSNSGDDGIVNQSENLNTTLVINETEEETPVAPDCFSCLYEGDCLEEGKQVRNADGTYLYCDLQQGMLEMKETGSTCENNFECLDQLCIDAKCGEEKKRNAFVRFFSFKWLFDLFR